MKKVTVSTKIADMITRCQSESGLNEQKAFLCDAMTAAIRHISQSENYSEDDFMPLQAISDYKDLIEELGKSEESCS